MYKANSDPFVPPAAAHEPDLDIDDAGEPRTWKESFAEVENALTRILDAGPLLGIKDLDPDVQRQLTRFRTELELFYAYATLNA